MAWRLPPLNAIRAFEVAGRHSSFTRAADELFVTPGAISRQVRGLEDFLGRSLFDRNYRAVVLNNASRTYAAELFEAFARIDRATRTFAAWTDQRKLKIYAPSTFALRWLLPRLSRYHAKFPDQGISISSLPLPPTDLQEADIDVAIRFAGASSNTVAVPLLTVELLPVCSPAFLAAHRVKRPRDLMRLPLLQSSRRAQDWNTWCAGQRVAGIDDADVTSFDSSSMVYQAALSGVGVAISMRLLVEDDLASGRLVAPLPDAAQPGETFHTVYAAPSETDAAVQGFVQWITDEAAGMHAEAPA